LSEIATREFEVSALSFFLQKPTFYAQKRKDLKDISFTNKKIRLILDELDRCWVSYNNFPTKHEFLELMKFNLTQKGLIDIEWEEYEDTINEAYNKEVTELTGERINLYIADEVRKRLAQRLLDSPLDKLSEVSKEVEGSLKILRRTQFQEMDFGLDFFNARADLKKLLHDYNHGACVPTGYTWLDEALCGGSRLGELNCVVGSTGLGKTTWLINMTRMYLNSGSEVLHVYLDSTKEETATRLCTCLLGEPIDYGADLDMVLDRIWEAYPEYGGRLFLKQYPAKAIDIDGLDELITNFKAYKYQIDKEAGVKTEEEWGKFQALQLDYFELLDYNGNEDAFMLDEAKAQRLNALCIKHEIATWTGSQGGTEAMKSDKPKLYMAHGFKNRFHPMANILMLCCAEEERMLLTRRFTADGAKFRRPSPYPSIPFILDVTTQRIYEDTDRCPKTGGTKPGAPDQTREQQGGTQRALNADETANTFV